MSSDRAMTLYLRMAFACLFLATLATADAAAIHARRHPHLVDLHLHERQGVATGTFSSVISMSTSNTAGPVVSSSVVSSSVTSSSLVSSSLASSIAASSSTTQSVSTAGTFSASTTAGMIMIDGTTGNSDIAAFMASITPDRQLHIGATSPNYTNQLGLLVDFADPSILFSNGTWYAYATNNKVVNVQVATSTNFRDWHLMKGYDALPNTGQWTFQSAPRVWAPDVFVNDAGLFVMTYTARPWWQYGYHCVGTAVSSSPIGPFVPTPSVLACPVAQGGAIDSSGFRDPATNNLYIVYKIDGNTKGQGGICNNMVPPQAPTPIMLQRMAGDGITSIGPPVQIFDRTAQDGPLVEAPNLFFDPKSSRYVLFYSSGCYANTNYDAAYVFSANLSILGPYVRRNPAPLPMSQGGVPSQRVLRTGIDGLHSPGGATVVQGSGNKVGMVYHAYTDGNGTRSLFTATITVDATRQRISTRIGPMGGVIDNGKLHGARWGSAT